MSAAFNFRVTFTTPHEQHRERIGQPFTVIREIVAPDAEVDAECLPMFVIRFPDGFETHAWPDEVLESGDA